MALTKMQRNILKVGVVIAILFLVFPPWEFYVDTSKIKVVRDAGYHLLWNQPKVPLTSVYQDDYGFKRFNGIAVHLWSARINTVKLLIQLILLTTILTLVVTLFKRRK